MALASSAVANAHAADGHGYHDGDPVFFDPGSVMTLSGHLTLQTGMWEVRGHGNHTGGGMGFEFKTNGGEEFELMVAPVWFLEQNGIALGTGERVTITGSILEEYDNGNHHGGGSNHAGAGHGSGMMGGNDHRYLIATRIVADGVALDIRDDEGYPIWRGGPDWAGHRWFAPEGITTMTGRLDELQGLWSVWGQGNHTGNGLHYTFDSDGGETFYAMVGPWWFMRGQGLKLGEGKRVEIRGAVVDSYWSKYDDHRFFIATEIKIGGTTAQLRDDWGYPLWHGTGWHYNCPDWAAGSINTLSGEVVKILRKKNGRFLDKGFEVVMESNGQRYDLYVAPNWDVKHLGLRLRYGDEISVRGSINSNGGNRRVVVQYIEFEGRRWHFRTSNGKPMWVKGSL